MKSRTVLFSHKSNCPLFLLLLLSCWLCKSSVNAQVPDRWAGGFSIYGGLSLDRLSPGTSNRISTDVSYSRLSSQLIERREDQVRQRWAFESDISRGYYLGFSLTLPRHRSWQISTGLAVNYRWMEIEHSLETTVTTLQSLDTLSSAAVERLDPCGIPKIDNAITTRLEVATVGNVQYSLHRQLHLKIPINLLLQVPGHAVSYQLGVHFSTPLWATIGESQNYFTSEGNRCQRIADYQSNNVRSHLQTMVIGLQAGVYYKLFQRMQLYLGLDQTLNNIFSANREPQAPTHLGIADYQYRPSGVHIRLVHRFLKPIVQN